MDAFPGDGMQYPRAQDISKSLQLFGECGFKYNKEKPTLSLADFVGITYPMKIDTSTPSAKEARTGGCMMLCEELT